LGEGEAEISPSPYLGEGFRVRAKTTVLNIDEVYLPRMLQNINSLDKQRLKL